MIAAPQVRGQAGAKLLLFGEHAAVYGHPAVGIHLPLMTDVTLSPSSGGQWMLPDLEPAYMQPAYMEPVLQALARAEEVFVHPDGSRLSDHRGSISFRSTVPLSSGFGSSASLSVALVRALHTMGYELRDQDRLPGWPDEWRAANLLEETFHGTPSGIDAGLCSLGGVVEFRGSSASLPHARHISGPSFCIVASSVPRRGSTRELVAGLRRRMEAGETEVADDLAALGSLSSEAVTLLENPDGSLSSLAHYVDRAHELLSGLGLGHPDVDAAIETGRGAGALGGKISGAGGGGAFFLLCRDVASARRVAQALAVDNVDQRQIFGIQVAQGNTSLIDAGTQ